MVFRCFLCFSVAKFIKVCEILWKPQVGVSMFIHVVSSSTPFQRQLIIPSCQTLRNMIRNPRCMCPTMAVDIRMKRASYGVKTKFKMGYCHWKHGNTVKIKYLNIVTSSTCAHVVRKGSKHDSAIPLEFLPLMVTLSVQRQVLYSAGGWQKHPETEGVFLASGRYSI